MTKAIQHTEHLHAIYEIIHHWFAFFEGETVTAKSQCRLFTEDAQIVHAGQHLLANGVEEIERWLLSVPPEHSSHTLDNLSLEALSDNQYQVTWQTAYQAQRHGGQVGGSIIAYQALITIDEDGQARFRALQKTPMASNPNTRFVETFKMHRIKALKSRLAQLATTSSATPALSQYVQSPEMANLLDSILTQTDLTISDTEAAIIATTPVQSWRFDVLEQGGLYIKISQITSNSKE
ncbi:hypothetical protein [Marinomonas ostreistagni]|uniref:hypothetical protein n=1 Tax=Marinomonas ostreistagni TaxID=359209 RepID=UPI00195237E5|nr:hypothetical protein [Marinomonas ostreistagni]MBM6550057.1 hypothetical protein [Marinomonas ostreistagni]